MRTSTSFHVNAYHAVCIKRLISDNLPRVKKNPPDKRIRYGILFMSERKP